MKALMRNYLDMDRAFFENSRRRYARYETAAPEPRHFENGLVRILGQAFLTRKWPELGWSGLVSAQNIDLPGISPKLGHQNKAKYHQPARALRLPT